MLSIYKSITTDHSLSPDTRESLQSYTTNGLKSPYDEPIRVAYSKGYDGDTVYLNKQEKTELLSGYPEGAASAGHREPVMPCINKEADPNAGLRGAARSGRMDMVQLMLESGATDYGIGLKGAAKAGHMYIVKMMLDKGADPYVGLHIAAEYGHTEIVKYLFELTNVDINKKDVYGKTPLDKALRSGNPECVKFILAAGGV